MANKIYDQEFERLWREQGDAVLRRDADYCKLLEGYRPRPFTLVVFYGIPIVAGIVSMDMMPFESELLKWAGGAVVTVVLFVLGVMLHTVVTGGKSIGDVVRDVKQRSYENYQKTGKLQ